MTSNQSQHMKIVIQNQNKYDSDEEILVEPRLYGDNEKYKNQNV